MNVYKSMALPFRQAPAYCRYLGQCSFRDMKCRRGLLFSDFEVIAACFVYHIVPLFQANSHNHLAQLSP